MTIGNSKYLLTLGLALQVLTIFSQTQKMSTDLEKLSREITAGRDTDEKKVRAIYEWVTSNIDYMTRPAGTLSGSRGLSDMNDTGGLKSLDLRVAEAVVANGMGVCDGYARLFKVLCEYAGVRAELVQGYAKGRRAVFASNHTWNAVLVDDQWRLIDVTWASGYISLSGNRFIRELDDSWYFVSPRIFINDHFPDDPRWTLLDDIPVLSEFNHSPFRQRSFIKYRIESYFPRKGVIHAVMNDLVELTLKISDLQRDKQVGSDPFLDTSIYTRENCILLRPAMVSNDQVLYQYKVSDHGSKWIYLMYNDDIVLRYYLKPNRASR